MPGKIQEFLNSFAMQEKINYGLNIHLLNKFIDEALIFYVDSDTDLREVIHSKEKLLKQINPLTYIFASKDDFEIDGYLRDIEAGDIFNITEDFEEDIGDTINFANLINNSPFIGFTAAFSFELNIASGHDDYKQKYQEHKKKIANAPSVNPLAESGTVSTTMPQRGVYSQIIRQIDHIAEDASWPCTQMRSKSVSANGETLINKLPIFAFTGFSVERIKKYEDPNFEATGFFFEIAKQNIQYMIAIGFSGPESLKGSDFLPYYILTETYFKKDKDGNILAKVHVKPKQSIIIHEQLVEHVLECHFEIYNPETKEHTHFSHTFTVLNIPVKDGSPLRLDPAIRAPLFNNLLEKLNNGFNIGAHCRAGRGRTGELLMILIALYTKQYDALMSENYLNVLHDYALDLREQRAGMVLEWTQLYEACYFILQTAEYIKQHSKRKITPEEEEKDPNNVKRPKMESKPSGMSSDRFFSLANEASQTSVQGEKGEEAKVEIGTGQSPNLV